MEKFIEVKKLTISYFYKKQSQMNKSINLCSFIHNKISPLVCFGISPLAADFTKLFS